MFKNFLMSILVVIYSVFFISCGKDVSKIEKPLPNEAFNAKIEIVSSQKTMNVSQVVESKIKVTNNSKVLWPAKGIEKGKFEIRLGNKWFQNNVAVIKDQSRALLPYDLKPDESVEIVIKVKAPSVPGRYQLVFDMVQEGVIWFKDKGSSVLSYNVIVE